VLFAVVAVGVVVTGCGSTPGPSSSASPRVVAVTASPTIAPDSAGSSSPVPTGSSGPIGSSGSSESVQVDPGLLSFIPVGGNGLIRTVDPDTAANIATDPSLKANASALMIAIYMPEPSSMSAAPAEDFAVVSVIRLRDPHADDAWFRAWRDSYDAAVCAQAGGVKRNSETAIGTHTVFVGSCAGGSFTYHTRIADGAIVISINSVGPANLGRTVMERLAP
jgi:hypothetical protein